MIRELVEAMRVLGPMEPVDALMEIDLDDPEVRMAFEGRQA